VSVLRGSQDDGAARKLGACLSDEFSTNGNLTCITLLEIPRKATMQTSARNTKSEMDRRLFGWRVRSRQICSSTADRPGKGFTASPVRGT
jgi:hypothetical protein